MHYLFIFLIYFCSKIFFDQKVFSFCWGKLDYPGSIVYLSCFSPFLKISLINQAKILHVLFMITQCWISKIVHAQLGIISRKLSSFFSIHPSCSVCDPPFISLSLLDFPIFPLKMIFWIPDWGYLIWGHKVPRLRFSLQ